MAEHKTMALAALEPLVKLEPLVVPRAPQAVVLFRYLVKWKVFWVWR